MRVQLLNNLYKLSTMIMYFNNIFKPKIFLPIIVRKLLVFGLYTINIFNVIFSRPSLYVFMVFVL